MPPSLPRPLGARPAWLLLTLSLAAACASQPPPPPAPPRQPDAEVAIPTKWKFARYFSAVKRQIREKLDPGPLWRPRMLLGPGTPEHQDQDRFVQLMIELRPEGPLERVQLLTRSGDDSLDRAILEAVRQAAPFPPAPRPLVDPTSQLVQFRMGFLLQPVGQVAAPAAP